jgi:hypothetical protein
MGLFRASEGILAQKIVSLASTILLLQQMTIFPNEGICKTCNTVIIGDYKKSTLNFLYWQCPYCKGQQEKLPSGKIRFWRTQTSNWKDF